MPSVFDQLGALGTGIAALAIVLVVAFLILSQGKQQIGEIEGITDVTNATQCATSKACNATVTLQGAVDDIPGWVPLVVIAAIGAILLGLVGMFTRR
tara:strand:+ start:12489 stop:12779 length:291 start_codon:yes stop_codon:yes gene_type:complete